MPSDKAIWTSIRSANIHRLSRNFLWKCIHNTFRVGSFCEHIPNLEIIGQCPNCRVTESLEHILLEYDVPGQRQIWNLTERLWNMRFLTGQNLIGDCLLDVVFRFKTPNGSLTHFKNRFFTILVLTAMQLIWNLRNERVLETHRAASDSEIHNRWTTIINSALKRDILLTDRIRFGTLAIKKQVVLNTWSGVLLDEDSLPDDWTRSKGNLVGTVLFRSIRVRLGIFDTIKIQKKSDKLRKNYCRNNKKVGVMHDNELNEIVQYTAHNWKKWSRINQGQSSTQRLET
ncbi:hypothetical protein B0H14DRAFT_2342674 [Mycena olivaceomarginata]|nr:hypothetical protein B0H14DRAFT_2342674 [Mycena olivaceomarginata]